MYFESKFIALEHQKDLVQNFLDTHLSGSDPFPEDIVHNLYFDTFDLRSAQQAFFNANLKKKFRLRLYSSTLQYSLQIKKKSNYLTDKHKAIMLIPDSANPFQKRTWSDLFQFVPESQKSKHVFQMENFNWGELSPLVSINYRRQRFRIGDYRITWDTDLKYEASPHFSFALKRAAPSHGILEIKSNSDSMPSFISHGLGMELKKTNISKFKSSLTSLRILHPPFVELERKDYGFKSIV